MLQDCCFSALYIPSWFLHHYSLYNAASFSFLEPSLLELTSLNFSSIPGISSTELVKPLDYRIWISLMSCCPFQWQSNPELGFFSFPVRIRAWSSAKSNFERKKKKNRVQRVFKGLFSLVHQIPAVMTSFVVGLKNLCSFLRLYFSLLLFNAVKMALGEAGVHWTACILSLPRNAHPVPSLNLLTHNT